MPLKFVIRFASILFSVLILAAIGIHSLFPSELTVVLWIFTVPIILAVPILTSVVFAKDEELCIPIKVNQ
ncbi:hypothetical protein [Acinetobacter piscicola]|uniref:hypothetical protein n=1 Tax=Acinetobacter piscicola TaxID=2006115 RepID=UPI000B7FFD64|nr:hypothetical protein [Acinetobacter piscicola]